MERVFKSLDNIHEITILIDKNNQDNKNKECWFNIDKFDESNCKTFLLLIKEVIEYISKNEIIIIKHYMNEEDTKYLKNSDIVKYMDDIYIVKTQINVFVDEIIRLFNIKTI